MSLDRWSPERAARWHAEQPWLVGCNFTPSTASNQLEMWQAETFDAETIARELLDDCWFPPRAGPQLDPVPGVHNSRWAQSPGHAVVRDRAHWPRLERYVRGVIEVFRQDERICVWDLYNEPGNAFLPVASLPGYRATPIAIARALRHFVLPSPTLPLLRACFDWARAVEPTQPLTAGLWAPVPRLARFQLEASDVISFHQYADAEKLASRIDALARAHGRPLLCSEWMARPLGSRVETHLPIFEASKVGCYCWGLVSGRTQTIHGWGDRPGTPEPELWHHDLLRPDGSPFDAREVEVMRRLTRS